MEIEFEKPIMLLLLMLIPLMIALHYYFFEHNRKRAMKFANFSAMKRVTGSVIITRNNSQLYLRIIIMIVIIFSAARPVIWYNGLANTADYVIAIDSSASMISEDVLPNRLTVAKNAAKSFIDTLDTSTKVGVLSFTGITFIKIPLTDSMSDARNEISAIDIELSGGTDIGSAIITASNMLSSSENVKTLILLTDGSDTAGGFIEDSFEIAVDYANKNHVKIHTIGIGSESGRAGYIEGVNIQPVYDRASIKMISERTGGNFFEVKNTAEIAVAFKTINQESQEAEIPLRLYSIFLALGLILLIVEWGLLNTRFRALP